MIQCLKLGFETHWSMPRIGNVVKNNYLENYKIRSKLWLGTGDDHQQGEINRWVVGFWW
jgi:hypothetical protein